MMLICSANCIVQSSAIDHATTFAITRTKLHVPVVPLSNENNEKLLQ